MSKREVLLALEGDMTNPGSQKSGEFLAEHVLWTAQRFVAAGDRSGLIDAMQEWLRLRRDPQTMLAVKVVAKERLVELASEVRALRADVEAGRTLWRYYVRWIDDALDVIESSGS